MVLGGKSHCGGGGAGGFWVAAPELLQGEAGGVEAAIRVLHSGGEGEAGGVVARDAVEFIWDTHRMGEFDQFDPGGSKTGE